MIKKYIGLVSLIICKAVHSQSIDGNTTWQTLVGHAESAWQNGEGTTTLNYSTSGGHFQEMYYSYWNTEAQRYLWQITGDLVYLNRHLTITDNYIDDAVPVAFNGNYLGWLADSSYSLDYPTNGVGLWESYYWKSVATVLRILHQSPNLRAQNHNQANLPGSTYQDVFDDQLAFIEEHIWDKWWANGTAEIYRQLTHMASHWARIAMELYIITGELKYSQHRDDFDFDGFPSGPYIGESMRGQIINNPSNTDAYLWDDTWGANGPGWQDTYHLSDIVAYMVLSEEEGVYWNENDMQKLVTTVDEVIFPTSIGANITVYMDGSGGNDIAKRFRDNGLLGAYDASLNARLATQYVSAITTVYDTQYYAIMARNKYILDGNEMVYPESNSSPPPSTQAASKSIFVSRRRSY